VKKEFVLDTGKGKVRLQYKEENGVTEFYHTFTPPKLRGQNLASIVSKAAFLHALSSNMRLKVTCSYLTDTFLPRNRELDLKNILVLTDD